MNVGVVGSRTFSDYKKLSETLDKYAITTIVSGGAKGADSLAEKYAKAYGLEMVVFKPNWELGKRAGRLRNSDIVNASDMIVAFWDGKSKGTLDSINKAELCNKFVEIVYF